MAIPEGRTSSNLESVARWTLAAVVILGMLSWPVPGLRVWGALAAGLLTVWAVWLAWRTVQGDRSVTVHPIYLAMAAPVVILTLHVGQSGLGTQRVAGTGLSGVLDMSAIFHFWLLGMGVMLTQSLLPRAAGHPGVLAVCGAAMMAGTVLAVALGPRGQLHSALALAGMSGLAVWLTPLWGLAPRPGLWTNALRGRSLRIAIVAAAGIAAGMLGWLAPREAGVAAGVVAAVMLAAGVTYRQGRSVFLGIGAGLAVLAALAMLAWPPRFALHGLQPGLIGHGEQAFVLLSADDTGLAVLAGMTGWVGLGGLLAGAAAVGVYLLGRARAAPAADRRRAIVWTIASVLAGCAMLTRGGLYIPSVTLAVAFTWGLLPAMTGSRPPKASGAWLLVVLVFLMLLLGLVRKGGLANWIAIVYGGNDRTMHMLAGFFLAMMTGWLLGARRIVWGLLGIVVAILLGAAGELLQGLFSRRSMQLADWTAHIVGCAAAMPLYLLCMTARWCESSAAKGRAVGH